MKPVRMLIALLLVATTNVAVARAQSAPAGQSVSGSSGSSSQTSGKMFPKDVFADTGNRLPAIRREALDDAGKKLYDARTDGYGPGGIRLYSVPVAEDMSGVNDYLRHQSGLDPRLVELAILVTAREFDCEYVWTAHEPQGLKAGLSQETVDIVKYRRAPGGLGEKEAAIIQLGREAVGQHRVSSSTAARALNLFGNQGLVNMVSLMGDYASTCVLLSAFDQHVRPTDKPLLPIP